MIDIQQENAMFKHAIGAFAIAATTVLLSAGPVAADPWWDDDWSEECATYTVRPGWLPDWPLFDALGVRRIVQNTSGSARVCLDRDGRPVVERLRFRELPIR
ncbi:hypothetical protein [Nonomuraea glycinis]|uniref:hypothetical protein n=1 Tax=Nonomuraea glycinis TaxID=2047744 RepID=UPI002E1473B6|nr:hypothetical protein OHA68_26430 [Nonomuraea glycinis]